MLHGPPFDFISAHEFRFISHNYRSQGRFLRQT